MFNDEWDDELDFDADRWQWRIGGWIGTIVGVIALLMMVGGVIAAVVFGL